MTWFYIILIKRFFQFLMDKSNYTIILDLVHVYLDLMYIYDIRTFNYAAIHINMLKRKLYLD